MDESEKVEEKDEVVEKEAEAPVEEPVDEKPPPPPPPVEEPKAAVLPPEEKTQPSFRERERRVDEMVRLQFSDIMQTPVGPDGKTFVIELLAIDMDTKELLGSERWQVRAVRPTANEVVLRRERRL